MPKLTKEDVYYVQNNPQKVFHELAIQRSVNQADYKVAIGSTTGNTITVAQANAHGVVATLIYDLLNADGLLHDWYDGAITITATENSTSGTVSQTGGTAFEDGRCTIAVTTAGTWVAGEKITITVTQPTVKGTTVTNIPVAYEITVVA